VKDIQTDKMREKVISQAMQMFSEEGFKSIRMDDIASALNISKRTLYEMFGDKESLVEECIHHYFAEQKAEHDRVTSGAANVFEELVIALERWDDIGKRNYRILTGLRKCYPDILRDFANAHYFEGIGEMRTRLTRGIEQGLILDSIDMDIAISVYAYSMSGLVHMKDNAFFTWPSDVNFADALHYIMVHFIRGIATEKGIRIIDETMLKLKR